MMIFNKKDVFTSVTYEEAKRYIGEEGYFTNNFCTDLSKWDRRVLKDVYDPEFVTIDYVYHTTDYSDYGLFLPASHVTEVNDFKYAKYRSFKDLNEFSNTLGMEDILGNNLTYRTIASSEEHNRSDGIITNIIKAHNEIYLGVGGDLYSLDELFEKYEWLDKDGNWRPFGVEK